MAIIADTNNPKVRQELTKGGGIILRVTQTVDYYFPARYTNGWKPDVLVDQFFVKSDINSSHAARDGARIGNSTKIISIEVRDGHGVTEYQAKGVRKPKH